MATVVAVHGTFAHVETMPAGDSQAGGADKQWWEHGSTFEADLKTLVEAREGSVQFEPFVWDGENSERSRRTAGTGLLQHTGRLEAAGKPYVLIGHSHGGSVIAATFMEAVARRKPLGNMQRWLSVGTPFVNLRKEPFLFSRIPLILQAIYVALLLFVVMFLVPLVLGLIAGDDARNRYMGQVGMADLDSVNGIVTVVLTTLAFSSMFILFYAFLVVMDRRRLHMYRPSHLRKAGTSFGPRWVGLTHEDDEIVQGLRTLGTTKFSIFNTAFFVPIFTAMAIFALPIAYIALLFSPSAMIGITEYLKTHVYQYQASKPLVDEAKRIRDEFRTLRRDMRTAGLGWNSCRGDNGARQPGAKSPAGQVNPICTRWLAAQVRYRDLRKAQPDLPRTLRFEASYLDPQTGQLQGNGRDTRVNSWMLFNLMNDSITRTLGIDQLLASGGNRRDRSDRQYIQIIKLLVPALVIPLLFALSAIVVLFVVRRLGGVVSGYIANAFDGITWRQIRRSALGNDTNAEVADAAAERPSWLSQSPPYLPAELGEKISDQSNLAAAQSLGKFRNAISTLAFADGKNTNAANMANYFTWKELVHSSYFDVPEFRKLVAYAIAQTEGFQPSAAFKADPDYARVAAWYEGVLVSPGKEFVVAPSDSPAGSRPPGG